MWITFIVCCIIVTHILYNELDIIPLWFMLLVDQWMNQREPANLEIVLLKSICQLTK